MDYEREPEEEPEEPRVEEGFEEKEAVGVKESELRGVYDSLPP